LPFWRLHVTFSHSLVAFTLPFTDDRFPVAVADTRLFTRFTLPFTPATLTRLLFGWLHTPTLHTIVAPPRCPCPVCTTFGSWFSCRLICCPHVLTLDAVAHAFPTTHACPTPPPPPLAPPPPPPPPPPPVPTQVGSCSFVLRVYRVTCCAPLHAVTAMPPVTLYRTRATLPFTTYPSFPHPLPLTGYGAAHIHHRAFVARAQHARPHRTTTHTRAYTHTHHTPHHIPRLYVTHTRTRAAAVIHRCGTRRAAFVTWRTTFV